MAKLRVHELAKELGVSSKSLLAHLGATVEPGHGARFRILLNRHEFFVHHPHHGNEFAKQEIKHLRECLAGAGVSLSKYDEERK